MEAKVSPILQLVLLAFLLHGLIPLEPVKGEFPSAGQCQMETSQS